MAATIGAARSPLEMITGGEDHVTACIKVVVRVRGNHPSGFRKNGPGIVKLAGNTSNRFETGPAKARRREAIRREPAQNRIRHADLMAPAGTLVEFAFRYAALVVTAAQGTLFIQPQTKVRRLRCRRLVFNSLRFHEIRLVQAWGIVSRTKTTTCSGLFK
jgi:hypothetical protein